MTRSLPALVVTCSALACVPNAQPTDKCTTDEQCGEYRRCNTGNGACLCTSDEACDDSEFCNLAGACQPELNCLTNAECKTDENPAAICDVQTGQCITLDAVTTQCVADDHCPFGFFCRDKQCVLGCQDNGDCPLGQPCMDGACNPAPNACNGNGYCEFGQSCIASGAGPDGTCATHADADILCARCRGDDPTDQTCDVCLIDGSVPYELCNADSDCGEGYCVHFPCLDDSYCGPGETCDTSGFGIGECTGHCGDFFCGNDSCDDATDPCPRGYNCVTVVLVSNNACTRGGGECPAGASCSADSGAEGQESGFCSCLQNSDCPNALECVNPGPGGGCVAGSTCAPQEGFQCEDLR